MQEFFSLLFGTILGGAEPNIFMEMALILIGAGFVAYVAHFLKQPSVIAYILVGLIIGPLGFYHLRNAEIMEGLSTIGITLLLFMVGLDLDISQLKRIGKSAVLAGVIQVVVTAVVGFGLTLLLGFPTIAGWLIAIALTFSSTIIVVKLLNEKKDLQSLYGKLAVGIFLIQDVAAIFLLVCLSALTGTDGPTSAGMISQSIVMTIAKAFMAGIMVLWLSQSVFPRIIKTIDKSDELMLLFSLGWSLGLAAVFSLPAIGFNPAIGGFVAGIALANTGVHHQISGRIKSLRDFFIIIFFIILGSQLVLENLSSAIMPALVLSAFVLIGKPLLLMIILGLMGYKPRTSFMTGITLAQISEFSLILVTLGISVGQLEQQHAAIITLTAIITIALSSYAIIYANTIYSWLKWPLSLFDFHRKSGETLSADKPLIGHVVLIGAHRLGSHILDALGKKHEDVLLVDFNPDVIHKNKGMGFEQVCGDITDPYIQEVAHLEKAKLIVSTVPDFNDTMALLELTTKFKRHVRTIVAANDETEAEQLYDTGADYVLLPHFIGGLHLADIIRAEHSASDLKKLRQKHLKTLKYILKNR